jgi:hypothetical protein
MRWNLRLEAVSKRVERRLLDAVDGVVAAQGLQRAAARERACPRRSDLAASVAAQRSDAGRGPLQGYCWWPRMPFGCAVHVQACYLLASRARCI